MKTVRDGQKVWPYCEECGCRLALTESPYNPKDQITARHFGGSTWNGDGQGHKCKLLHVPFYLEKQEIKEYDIIEYQMNFPILSTRYG